MLSVRFGNSLWRSDFLLFLEFINIVSILFYNFIEFIILLYIFQVISFAWYREYIICLIIFRKFSDILPAFTCARAISNLWSICLGVSILKLEWSETLAIRTMQAKSGGSVVPFSCLLKFKIISTILTILFEFSFLESFLY